MASDRAACRLLPVSWDDLLAFGLGRLGMSPVTFWQMTPRELRAVMEWHCDTSAPPPGREDLSRLMDDYPDMMKGIGDGQ